MDLRKMDNLLSKNLIFLLLFLSILFSTFYYLHVHDSPDSPLPSINTNSSEKHITIHKGSRGGGGHSRGGLSHGSGGKGGRSRSRGGWVGNRGGGGGGGGYYQGGTGGSGSKLNYPVLVAAIGAYAILF